MSSLEMSQKRLQELQEQRSAQITAMETVTAAAETEERAAFTDDEQTDFDAALASVKELDAEIDAVRSRIEDLEAVQARTEFAAEAQRSAPPGIPNVQMGRNPYDLSDLRFGAGREELSARVRSVLSEDRHDRTMVYLSPEERSNVENLMGTVDTMDGKLARRILLTGNPSYVRAFEKVMSGNEHGLADDERAAMNAWHEFRVGSLTDSAGGYAIPFAVDTTIIDTRDGSTNPFRQISTVKQTLADVWTGVSSAGVTASFDAEAAEVSDDTPTLAAPSITTRMARAFVPFSIEIGMDWANMDADIRTMFSNAKDDLEATVFATGAAGSNQPIGIVTALDGTASEVAPATVEVFAVADLYALEEALGPRYRGRASWVANKAIYNDIRTFGTSDSHALWERLGPAQPAQLLGYPVYEASAMDSAFDAAATADNFLLILGDFSNYYIIDRVGMNVELIPHLFATANNYPSGQRGMFAFWRVGADSVNDGGFSMLNVATTA